MTSAQKEIIDQFPDLDWFHLSNGDDCLYFSGLGPVPPGGEGDFRDYVLLCQNGLIKICTYNIDCFEKFVDAENLRKEIKIYYKFGNFK